MNHLFTRLALPLILLMTALAGSYAYLSFQLNKQSNLIHQDANRTRNIHFHLNRVNSLFSDFERSLLSYHFTTAADQSETMTNSLEEIHSSLAQIAFLELTPKSALLVKDLQEAIAAADNTRKDLLGAIQRNDRNAVQTHFGKWTLRSQHMNALLSDLNVYASLRLLSDFELFEIKQLRLSMLVFAVLFAAAFGILAFSSYFFKRMTHQLMTTNQELKTVLAARNNFISIASHELKTPLTSLILQTQLLRRWVNQGAVEPVPHERLEKAVELICTQTSRLNLLINDLLDVTRIRMGKMTFNFEETDLSKVVRDVFEQTQEHRNGQKCRLEMDLQEGLIGLWDSARLEQVVLNLVNNAMKYAPNSPIQIRTRRSGGQAVFTVRDSGPGILQEDQGRLFEQFERGSKQNSKDGLGLGLFIVKNIISSHGGTVEIQSQPGEGTTFIVSLPFTRASHEPSLKTSLS